MFDRRTSALLIVAALAACGGEATSTDPTPTTTPTTAPPATTTPPPTTAAATTVPVAPPVAPPVVAVWPAADVVFTTPEAAAGDFIATVFGVEPLLGPFLPDDATSGEFEVLSPLDDDDPATTRPQGVVLAMRRFGEGWFVLAATSEGVSITAPTALDVVAAGPLRVEGFGRGFEGTVVVRAHRPGATGFIDLDILITAWDPPVPYTAEVDLASTVTGDVVALIAVGDTGITATGEFAAIPVVIG